MSTLQGTCQENDPELIKALGKLENNLKSSSPCPQCGKPNCWFVDRLNPYEWREEKTTPRTIDVSPDGSWAWRELGASEDDYLIMTPSLREKAEAISTVEVLRFLAQHQGRWSTHGEGYSMPTVQNAMPPGTPYEVQLAKMRLLWGLDFVGGCPCGCRGDWEITDVGLRTINELRNVPYNGY